MSRLGYIDGLRGIAALMVLFQHVAEITTHHSSYMWPLLHAINLGRFGVLLFFLISGFVVPFSFKESLAEFSINRAARLLPALWLSVLIAVLWRISQGQMPDSATISANMAMVAWPLDLDLLEGVYWSLSYELAFYVICALLYTAGVLKSPKVIGSLAMTCLIPSTEIGLFFAFLFVGLLFRLSMENKAIAPWAVAIALAMAARSMALPVDDDSPFVSWQAMEMATTMALVVFSLTFWRKPVVPRWIVYLGAISYSVYLFQDPMLKVFDRLLGSQPGLFALSVVISTIIVASLVFRFVERPFIGLGRRYSSPFLPVSPEKREVNP